MANTMYQLKQGQQIEATIAGNTVKAQGYTSWGILICATIIICVYITKGKRKIPFHRIPHPFRHLSI